MTNRVGVRPERRKTTTTLGVWMHSSSVEWGPTGLEPCRLGQGASRFHAPYGKRIWGRHGSIPCEGSGDMERVASHLTRTATTPWPFSLLLKSEARNSASRASQEATGIVPRGTWFWDKFMSLTNVLHDVKLGCLDCLFELGRPTSATTEN